MAVTGWAKSAAALLIVVSACEAVPEEMIATDNVQDWRDEVIYQIVVDRFADGDTSNNYDVDEQHLGRYQGGDWQGIIDHIDYLRELGVTAVWISPVVRNVERSAGFDGYHGYWTQDFERVNPHFGDLAKLREMVAALHAVGIKVIGDIVVNHVGPLFFYDINRNGRADELLLGGGGAGFGSSNDDVPGLLTHINEWDPDYDRRGIQAFSSMGESGPAPIIWAEIPQQNRVLPQPAPFQNDAWYHRRGRITVWENQPTLGRAPCETAPEDNVELCDYVRSQEIFGDFPGGLKDLATEKPAVRRALIEVYKKWIELVDFDGYRIDTLKHVEPDFFFEFCPAIRQHARSLGKGNFLLAGEAFSGVDQLLGSYTAEGGLDSVFYFSQKFQVIDDVFKRGAPTAAIEALHAARLVHFNDAPQPGGLSAAPRELLINFLDDHDMPRFLSDGRVSALRPALTYLLTTSGIPCIYYGTEQRFNGGNDPANREVLWRGNPEEEIDPFDTSGEIFALMRTLIALRKEHAALRRGMLEVKWSTDRNDGPDAGIFAFERQSGDDRVLVVINATACREQNPATSRTTSPAGRLKSGFAPDTELVNIITGKPGGQRSADRFVVSDDGEVEVVVGCEDVKILVDSDAKN